MNDFRNDLDPLALALSNENIENPSSVKPDSTKKRKADDISSNNYEDTNRELRELYELRRQRTGANKDLPTENGSTSPEKILLNFKAKENQTPVVEETKSDENLVKEYICEPLPARKLTPDICISKLKNYPDDCLTNNMMTFEKLVSEDLKGYSFGKRTTLQAAFMTTFGYSLDLIEPLLNQGVKIVLADDWKNINEPRIEKSFPEHPFFTLIRSPKDPTKNYQGTFHAKLMLLKFPTFLRVVVSSGNLTHDDWNILSNCLWFKDFPKIKSVQLSTSQNANPVSNEFDYDSDFRTTLTSFVQSLMPTPQTVYSSLLGINIDDYHISGIDIVLIPSIPGRHTGPDLEKYGHRKIGTVLRKLAPYSVKPKKQILTYQTSSLGNLEEKFLKEVMTSFVPSYMKVEDLNHKKKKGELNPVIAEPASKRIKVIFPTKQYVESCNEGPQSAYCIVLNGKEYEKETFPKQIFHQFEAPEHYFFHEGVVPHLKVFLVTEENSEITDDSYMYLGSHNFSASAWGRYESGCSKISIYNTELGILIPPAKGSKQRKLDILNGLSFKFPPTKYASNQVPWTIRFGL